MAEKMGCGQTGREFENTCDSVCLMEELLSNSLVCVHVL